MRNDRMQMYGEDYSLSQVIVHKNNIISKNVLDENFYDIRSVDFQDIKKSQLSPISSQKMIFFRIYGITQFWKENVKININSLMSDMLCGMDKEKLGYTYIIRGDRRGITVSIGIDETFAESLKSSLLSLFPNINIEETELEQIVPDKLTDGGIITGIPTDKLAQDGQMEIQIDHLCRGMQGKDFVYVLFAEGISPAYVTQWHTRLLEEMSKAYEYQKSGINESGITVDKQSFVHTRYFENLEALEKTYHVGVERGMWYYTGYFGVNEKSSGELFGNLIRATFSGIRSKPEKMRTTYCMKPQVILKLIRSGTMLLDLQEDYVSHPLGEGAAYKFQTIINSDQLGVLSALPMKEYPGYYVDNYVEFDLSNRPRYQMEEPVPIGDIVRAGRSSQMPMENIYAIEKNDYTRHCLIIGITGGGKTNTSKSLLRTLWCQEADKRIPFLVIESAKREYWELRNLDHFEDLMVYTLGSEDPQSAVRYRLNPFETIPGISLQSHIDLLLATFKTAFEMYPPMPYVLETAVYEIYKDRGWDIVTNENRFGFTLYPTISDLYDKIGYTVASMGYDKEVSSNIRSALEARIHSLMIGGKGAMLNTSRSVPIVSLLSCPTVLELEDIGDDETKSFVIGILLVQLYEYRKCQKDKINGAKKLQHILIVEEAHRLLKHVSEEANPTQAKSVEFFCNMLAEIRTYGQGIFIADQIPTKLAPDTIKNTNLKIVHRTVAREDREAIGQAMNMSEDQIAYLSSLPRGFAAVYAEGDNRPKCVKFPLVTDKYSLTREQVIGPIKEKVDKDMVDDFKPVHCGCAYCENKCSYGDEVRERLGRIGNLQSYLVNLQKYNYAPQVVEKVMDLFEHTIIEFPDVYSRICLLGFLLEHGNGENGWKKKVISQYLYYFFKQVKWRK